MLALLYFYVFWTMFLACTALYAQWRTLPLPVRILSAPIGITMLAIDVLSNYTIATILFAELPARGCYTVTERLTFYLADSDWRSKVAHVICTYLLNPFQVGGHCKK